MFCDAFAIAFHVSLLKVGGQILKILSIGNYCLRIGTKKIVIPDPQQAQYYRHIFLQGCFPEVFVHCVCTCKQLREFTEPNGYRN